MRSVVLYPETVEPEKLLATAVYGGEMYAVHGNYDDCSRLVVELAGELDWAFVNVNLRAYYAEGSKTLAFEISEQLGWELPDAVVAPIASGSLFTKLWQGFEQFGAARARRGRPARGSTAARRRGARRSRTRSPTSGRCRRCVPRRSPTRSRSALPPTAISRSRPRMRRAARSTRCRRRHRPEHVAARRHLRRLRRDGRRRHDRRASRRRAVGRRSARTTASSR